MSFELLGYRYNYLHYHQNMGKYGLVITFWKSNLRELSFFLKYVNTWAIRPLMEISVCSNWLLPQELYQYCNYAVHSEIDLGHQDGTTLHCNGGMYPLLSSPTLRVATHTDADTIILNEDYFIGRSNRLLDLGKTLLTSGPTYVWDREKSTLVGHPTLGPDSATKSQFGSTFSVSRELLHSNYFPVPPKGNFETDRYNHYWACGFTPEGVIIDKRYPFSGDDFLEEFDFSLGVLHNANNYQWALNELRVLQGINLSCVE